VSQNGAINKKVVLIGGAVVLSLALLSQNCSEVSFTEAELKNVGLDADGPGLQNDDTSSNNNPTDSNNNNQSTIDPLNPPVIVCNPLSGDMCDVDSNQGLIGNLYYLLPTTYPGVIGQALLDDYRDVGTKVDELILFTQINVTPRSWTAGFSNGNTDDSLILDSDGNVLLEWFSVDLHGYLDLPPGEYQFAMISDDGMQVIIDDEVVLYDDGTHSPRVHCSDNVVAFTDEDKSIQVRYFQGPRNQIAMQLFMKLKDEPGSCRTGAGSLSGSWTTIPKEHFYH